MNYELHDVIRHKLAIALQETCYSHLSHAEIKSINNTIKNESYIRFEYFISTLTPWIHRHFDLEDADVLEIGCGAGSTTSAIAIMAKHVHAYDIQQSSVLMTRRRAEILHQKNISANLGYPDSNLVVDVILLCAVLEHMEICERLKMLQHCWKLLRKGGIMVIADTPNRLAVWDNHTTKLPFFNVLPDELAILYACKSPREDFKEAISQSEDKKHELYWWGRGLSYHEFELTVNDPNIIGDGYDPEFSPPNINETQLRDILLELGIHQGYSRNDLNLIFKK